VRGHHDRVAAGLRPRVGHQQGTQRARAHLDPRDEQHRRGGEPDRVRLGPGDLHAPHLLRLHRHLPTHGHEGAAMTASSEAPLVAAPKVRNPLAAKRSQTAGSKKGNRGIQIFLAVVALVWIFPVGYAVLNSFRDYAYTSKNGYLSFGGFTFDNYKNAWEQANFSHTMLNSAYITVPAVLLTLFLSACVAFVVARFS